MSGGTLWLLSLAPSLLVTHITLYACQLFPKLLGCDTCTIYLYAQMNYLRTHYPYSLYVRLHRFARVLSLLTKGVVTDILS